VLSFAIATAFQHGHQSSLSDRIIDEFLAPNHRGKLRPSFSKTFDRKNAYVYYLAAADICASEGLQRIQAWKPYRLAWKSYGKDPRWSPRPETPKGLSVNSSDLDVLRAEAKLARPIAALLRDAANRPLTDRREAKLFDPRFDEVSAIKELAKVAADISTVDVADGKPGQAAQLLMDTVAMGRKVGGRDIIFYLGGNAAMSIAYREFSRELARYTVKECEQVAAAGERWLAEPFVESKALDGERTECAQRFALMLSDPAMWQGKDSSGLTKKISSMSHAQRDALAERVRARMGQRFAPFLARLNGAEKHWSEPPIHSPKVDDAHEPTTPEEFADMMGDISGSVTDDLMTTVVKSREQLRLLVLNAKVIGYKLRHGVLPATLSQAGGSDIDPLTARPYVYKTSGDGKFLLASEGTTETGMIELDYHRPKRK
jgi:hypothetical protein